MPSLRKDRNNGWWARVIVDGKQVACKMFPPGKKGGPEWRAAKEWEEETRKTAKEPPIPSGLELLLAWGDLYLKHVKRTMSRQTRVEKETVMRAFFSFCKATGIDGPHDVTRPLAYQFLSSIADEKSPNRANVYRKNLLAAWNWGTSFVEGFPESSTVIDCIRRFPVIREPRYVPPEEDVIKVLRLAKGQDLVFLLTIYFTGARRGELFRLTWDDVDFIGGRIRLTDHKGGNGLVRDRWLAMHPELDQALSWWNEARPSKVDTVFPYKNRPYFMSELCALAGVKPFGFHALRHKSAAITFIGGGLNAAQVLMGHSRATTTDIYVRSAGLYTDQGKILEALGNNVIGKAVSGLMEKAMHLYATPCTQEHVHDMLQ
jgi:integrase